MDKYLRPSKFEADPQSSNSDEEWKHWKKTFDNFLGAITAETLDKLKVLCNYVSPTNYRYIADCTNYDDAIKSLEEVFIKPKNEVFARHLLATAKQEPGMSLNEFLQKLRHLSKDCNFKTVDAAKYCEESMRDAFISGLSSTIIRQRLLEDATLDLQSVLTKARTLDLAQKNSASYSAGENTLIAAAAAVDTETHNEVLDFEEESTSAFTINKRINTQDNRKYNSKCKYCGNRPHSRGACPARNSICFKCSMKGHFSKVCKNTSLSASTNHTPTLAAMSATASYNSLSTACIDQARKGGRCNLLMEFVSCTFSSTFIYVVFENRCYTEFFCCKIGVRIG